MFRFKELSNFIYSLNEPCVSSRILNIYSPFWLEQSAYFTLAFSGWRYLCFIYFATICFTRVMAPGSWINNLYTPGKGIDIESF